MLNVTWSAGTQCALEDQEQSLMICVDIGFSRNSKSTGVAWQLPSGDESSENLTFGQAITRCVELLQSARTANLLIEAPLSGVFDEEGNPQPRGSFEVSVSPEGKTLRRYWYSGPGASTCLAASYFLRKLDSQLRNSSKMNGSLNVLLFEGFVTFKSETTDHSADARLLLDCFLGHSKCQTLEVVQTEKASVISILDQFECGTDLSTPMIIIPLGPA